MSLKIALLQMDVCWGAPSRNIEVASQLVESNRGADLYVLPEMWSTGFATEPEGIARDEAGNEAIEWMQRVAERHHCAVCGSVAVRLADHSYRNRFYFMDGRSGRQYHYDKHHLFTYGKEDVYYTPGHEHTLVEYGGMRFLLLTCYDLRFPCWSRYADALNYDAIIVVANWPESRQSAWQILTRARAIENQCYLIGVNRVGDDSYCHYAGASVVVDAIGRTMVQCRRHEAEVRMADIDLQELRRRRDKFKVLEDRDQ